MHDVNINFRVTLHRMVGSLCSFLKIVWKRLKLFSHNCLNRYRYFWWLTLYSFLANEASKDEGWKRHSLSSPCLCIVRQVTMCAIKAQTCYQLEVINRYYPIGIYHMRKEFEIPWYRLCINDELFSCRFNGRIYHESYDEILSLGTV